MGAIYARRTGIETLVQPHIQYALLLRSLVTLLPHTGHTDGRCKNPGPLSVRSNRPLEVAYHCTVCQAASRGRWTEWQEPPGCLQSRPSPTSIACFFQVAHVTLGIHCQTGLAVLSSSVQMIARRVCNDGLLHFPPMEIVPHFSTA